MRTDTTVRDVMHREFLGVSESDALSDAAKLMVAEGTDCLIVVRGGEPVGCLEARDALGAVLGGHADDVAVDAVMGEPLPTVAPDDPLPVVGDRLVSEGVSQVVVTEGGEAVGVVTEHDALAAGRTRGAERRERDGTVAAGVAESIGTGAAAGDGTGPAGSTTMAADAPDPSDSATQGVCEMCGSLVPSLTTSNGQAVCPACQEV